MYVFTYVYMLVLNKPTLRLNVTEMTTLACMRAEEGDHIYI